MGNLCLKIPRRAKCPICKKSKFTSKIDSYSMITINGCILCRMKQKYFSGSVIRVPDPVNIKILPKTPIYKLKNRKVTGRYYQIE